MLELPAKIRNALETEDHSVDNIGLSGSSVLLFPDRVLKIQEDTEEARNEIAAMQWLEGRLNAPKVIAHETSDGRSYLLMTRMPGKMACDPFYLEQPELLTGHLAKALRSLWQVDISACPLNWNLDRKLAAARYCVENGLVDVENTEPETFGPGGFHDPEELLQWLTDHRPPEEMVLSHGDFCLPNLYFDNGAYHFLDLGRTGVADKWQDIALCYRSLKHNFAGKYGGKVYAGYDPDMLFEQLGIAPDWEKIRYYTLLDELF